MAQQRRCGVTPAVALEGTTVGHLDWHWGTLVSSSLQEFGGAVTDDVMRFHHVCHQCSHAVSAEACVQQRSRGTVPMVAG